MRKRILHTIIIYFVTIIATYVFLVLTHSLNIGCLFLWMVYTVHMVRTCNNITEWFYKDDEKEDWE